MPKDRDRKIEEAIVRAESAQQAALNALTMAQVLGSILESTLAMLQAKEVVPSKVETLSHATAIFRQVNKNEPRKHHDALEFPDGRIVLLTQLCEGQGATVLQLPAQPASAAEADAQTRMAYAG